MEKVALVTGASRGIGAAIATRLAKDNFTILVNFVGNFNAAEKLVNQIDAAGGKAVTVQADVSDSSAVTKLFESVEATFGGIDAVINSAGIMKLATLAESKEEDFDTMVAVNLKGTFNTMREACKRLRPGGRIINLSSSVVGLYMPTYSIYAATKAAIEAMTQVMSKEMRGRNITVNAVAPGPTATELFLDGKTDEMVNSLANLSPLERLGSPEDIANTVAFLAGEQGGWINGQVIRVNGGII
ncbi:SDR family oxidoreductase [Microbulbifer sp. MLAF003]|uniref:SDR family oxidoreductase n=1 Tax=Microbulbifer sp. MLAF003 TaxID=3032582 RepID=UPI0024ACD4FB|nr:SDR family oxidoreductase [Microbulbifer sp. MLAF003]WHI53293.1 SDR family oxidoreductase [Microbulbifer sp. MLAF003]